MALLLTALGSLGLCLAMTRHQRQLFGGKTLQGAPRWLFRLVGWLGLTLGAWLCVQHAGLGVGLTLFFAYLTVCVFCLALLLPALEKRRKASDAARHTKTASQGNSTP